MHHELKQEAIRLRVDEEWSYNAIREKLGVSKGTLHEWLKHFPLSRERILELRRANWTKNQAKIERYRVTMAEKREQKEMEIYERYVEQFKTLSKDSFFIAGLMLYLAEGAKKENCRICIANTDARVIKFFMKWLSAFLDFPKDRFRAELHLYPTMDIAAECRYWEKELDIPKSQFYKTQIRELKKSSFSYSESFRHGTCSLNVSSVKKKAEIMMAIKAFMDSHLSDALRA
jgi:transposase-like protein